MKIPAMGLGGSQLNQKCYDYIKIVSQKNKADIINVFDPKHSQFLHKLVHNIFLRESQ
jgi:hypothetical protein